MTIELPPIPEHGRSGPVRLDRETRGALVAAAGERLVIHATADPDVVTIGATSWVGARGIMQLMPSTYHEIASHRPEFGPIDQPEWNIAAGIMHDRYLWDLWRKNIDEDDRHHFMFASYNAGEGTINRALAAALKKGGGPEWSSVERIAPSVQRWRYTETLGYVRRIDSTYAKLTGTP